jgi:hypothetical protein
MGVVGVLLLLLLLLLFVPVIAVVEMWMRLLQNARVLLPLPCR